jgi:hypothetical protein
MMAAGHTETSSGESVQPTLADRDDLTDVTLGDANGGFGNALSQALSVPRNGHPASASTKTAGAALKTVL